MVNGISDKPREIIAAAAGMTSLQEMDRNRSASSCCGAGGGRMWFDDEPETRIGTTRVQEALHTNASTVAVSCPFYLTMIDRRRRRQNRSSAGQRHRQNSRRGHRPG
ncbi:MAG: (Fe-S)-binding protein [Akkermansiaceae bacterium]|nr:(Fe-S)-binding protein [Akkermansiaceae bacterium]